MESETLKYDFTTDSAKQKSKYVMTQAGDQVTYQSIEHDPKLCKEFVITCQPFSIKRWLAWTAFFNVVGYLLKLHSQDSRVLTALLCMVIVALVVKLHAKVKKETLLVSSYVGVQHTTTFMSGRTKCIFYDVSEVKDIIINEGVTVHQVIFYLALLAKGYYSKNSFKLVPLFTHCWPRLDCLTDIYQRVQTMTHWKDRRQTSSS